MLELGRNRFRVGGLRRAGVVLLLSGLVACSLRSEDEDVALGRRAFERGDYEQALIAFERARDKEEGEAEFLAFNIGCAELQMARGEEDAAERLALLDRAVASFERAAGTDDEEQRARANYNLGNALYASGEMRAAAAAFERTLRLEPGNKAASYNLSQALHELSGEEPTPRPPPSTPPSQRRVPDETDPERALKAGFSESDGRLDILQKLDALERRSGELRRLSIRRRMESSKGAVPDQGGVL